MRTHTPSCSEPETEERGVHAPMPPVRRTLPWRVRQQNLAYRRAERAYLATESVATRGSPPALDSSRGDQYAEYFFDIRELGDVEVGHLAARHEAWDGDHAACRDHDAPTASATFRYGVYLSSK
jgi:hypothetical protein